MKSISIIIYSILFSNFILAQEVDVTRQYYFKQLGIEEAWKITKGSEKIKIGLISTGINFRIPEIMNSVLINPYESGINEQGIDRSKDGLDNDNNGFIDDVFTVNTRTGEVNTVDWYGIGTGETSLIASIPFGIAPNVKIIPVSVCDKKSNCDAKSIERAIDYVIQRGANLVHIGLAGSIDESIEGLCHKISTAKIPFMIMAGNEGLDLDKISRNSFTDCPDRNNMIVTTSLNESGGLPNFASYGRFKVDVAAPGVNLWALDQTNWPVPVTGNNFSLALTTAVSALILSAHPEYNVNELRNVLITSSTPLEQIQGKLRSHGRIHAENALSPQKKSKDIP